MKPSTTPARRLPLVLAAGAAAATLAGCASFPAIETPVLKRSDRVADAPQASVDASKPIAKPPESIRLPAVGGPPAPTRPEATLEQIQALTGPAPRVDVALPPQQLPQLLNTVFGEVLRVPYSLGPGVAARTEVVALRSAPQMSAANFLRLVQLTLKDYGLVLSVENGAVSVNESGGAASGTGPAIIRGRFIDAPSAARPVVQFFDVRTLDVNAIVTLLTDLVPAQGNVRIKPDPATNTLILAGSASDVASTARLLRELDQPKFAGQRVLRVQPTFFNSDGLALALDNALTAEGFSVSRQAVARRAIVILSLPTVNQLLIFAADDELLERAADWVSKLDQPASFGQNNSTFVYQVQNTDAATLGNLLTGSGLQNQQTGQQPAATGQPGQAPTQTAANNTVGPAAPSLPQPSTGRYLGGSVLVDPVGNRIIFTGTANDFAQLRTLLTTLDVAPKQVMIEVIIAEVTLTDNTQVGLEFFFRESMNNGVLTGGTEGGLGLGSSGLNLAYSKLDLRAAFNAFASNNKVNILSRPRLVARSGAEARIQVGTDVPIITSQRASDQQTGGDTDVLQTVQYRQTGVITSIRPTIYGDNRVDLEVTQEVSSQQGNPNAAIASPLILNRNLSTMVSLADGSTGVIGGLIDSSYSKGNSGIPFLKDVPLLGQAFRTDTVDGSKTELVMLVTPFIIRNNEDMESLAGVAAADMNAAFRLGRGWSYTLTPFGLGRGVGFDLPTPRTQSEVDAAAVRRSLPAAPATAATAPAGVDPAGTTRAGAASVNAAPAATTPPAQTAPATGQQPAVTIPPTSASVVTAAPPAAPAPAVGATVAVPAPPTPTPRSPLTPDPAAPPPAPAAAILTPTPRP